MRGPLAREIANACDEVMVGPWRCGEWSNGCYTPKFGVFGRSAPVAWTGVKVGGTAHGTRARIGSYELVGDRSNRTGVGLCQRSCRRPPTGRSRLQ